MTINIKRSHVILASLVVLFILISVTGVTAVDADNTTTTSVSQTTTHEVSSNIETNEVNTDVKYMSNNDLVKSDDSSTSENVKVNKNVQKETNSNKVTATSKNDDSNQVTSTTKKEISSDKSIKTANTINSNTSTKKINPNIRLNNEPLKPGTNTTFVAVVPSDAKGLSVFKINGKTISNKIAVNGSLVTYNYAVPKTFKSKTYTLTFVYSGDEKYLSKKVNTTLELDIESGLNPKLTMNNITGKYLNKIPFTVNLASDATGNVVFKLNRTTVSGKINVVNGKATYYFYNSSVNPGKYRLDAYYSGNEKYSNSSVRAYLTITKLSAKINVKNITSKAGSRVKLFAHVYDERNQAVAHSMVVFKIDSITVGRCYTNATGYAIYNYTIPPAFNKRNFTINAFSTENKRVSGAQKNATLYLTQLKTRVVVPTITAQINKTITLTATVIDENKNNVLQGTVTFKLNGKVLKKVNVSKGYALYKFKPNTNVAKKFNVTAVYTGYWKYASSSNKGIISVTKIGTITTTRYAETKSGNSVVLSAMVKDKNQKNVNGGVVVFRVKGVVVGNATVKNGAANYTYNMNLTKKGVYRLNATYMGSNSYYKSSNLNYLNITQLSVRVIGTPTTVQAGKTASLKVYVLDETNHNVESGTVEFKLNGVTIGKATVKKGAASLSYKPPYKYAGSTVKYSATLLSNNYYNSASTVVNLTISTLKDVYVSTKGSNNNLGDKSHPFKTIPYAVGHVSTFGTVHILDGTYSTAGILLNNSISIVGNGITKTFISGNGTKKPIFTLTTSKTSITFKSLTIKNGQSANTRSAGAIVSIGKLNIVNVKFLNNKATGLSSGGAIYSNGIMNLTNVQFIKNSVKNINAEGGAIRAINNTTTMNNVRFENNEAVGSNSTGGGAIYLKDAETSIKGSTFIGNKASGKVVLGGAIKSTYGDIVLLSSTFKNNVAQGSNYAIGGAVNGLGTGLYINNTIMQSNKVIGNSFAGAGALYTQYAALELYNSAFTSNSAKAKSSMGGAIEAYYAYSNMKNTVFTSNYAESTATSTFGGAIYYDTGNLTMDKCRLVSNKLTAKNVSIGGALYVSANTTIKNSDFTSNKVSGKVIGGGAIANLGTLTVTKSNFISNSASNIGNAITVAANSRNTINGNYWGAASPKWTTLLRGLNKPSSYSKTKISH